MNPETKKIIEKTERDGERLRVLLQNVRSKIGSPDGYSGQDIDELLAEAEEFGG